LLKEKEKKRERERKKKNTNRSLSPIHLLTKSEELTEKKVELASVATALAK